MGKLSADMAALTGAGRLGGIQVGISTPVIFRLPKIRILALIFLVLRPFGAGASSTPPPTPNRMDLLMDGAHKENSGISSIDSLELIGIGVSIETFRNHPGYPKSNLWAAVSESNGGYIISQDISKYPKNFDEWKLISSKRNSDTIDVAMRDFMDRYPLPVVVVGPSWGEPEQGVERETSKISNAKGFIRTKSAGPYTARGEFGGLLTQSGQVMNSYLNDEPDLLWQTVFRTFNEYGDIPAVGIASKDGAMHRALSFDPSDMPRYQKLADEQVFRPKQARILSDSSTFIALARRGRIEKLRDLATLVNDAMKIEIFGDGAPARNWSEFNGWKKPPAQAFVPTPYIAEPWTTFQVEQYDHLENLGTLYRPQVISYLDAHGHPIKPAERVLGMEAALRAALAPLGGKMPARIFYDYGSVWDDRNSASRLLPLVQSLHTVHEEFDLLDPKSGFDLARILGDTGAGSPFIAVALASMAGRQSGGATLVANLRRNDGATLLLVTPPSAEQVKKDAAIKRPYFPGANYPRIKVQ